MQKMKLVALSFLLTLASMLSCGAATAGNMTVFSTVFTYPSNPPAPKTFTAERSRVFLSHGKAFRLRLYSESDSAGNFFGFVLELEKAIPSYQGPNLLDPTGKIHGYQKWDFLASEFARDHAPPGWGTSRTVDLPKLGMKVQMNVVRYGVKPTHATQADTVAYKFTNLTLKVVIQNEAVIAR